MNSFQKYSLRSKFLIPVIFSSVIIIILLVTVMSFFMYKTVKEQAIQKVQKISDHTVAEITKQIVKSLETTQTISSVLESLSKQGNLTRDMVNAMILRTLENSPSIYGFGSNWEPDSIGGFDKNFIGKPCSDKRGRFFTYTIRDPKGIPILSCGDYDFDTDKTAEIWYHTPKKLGTQLVTNPYLYPVDEKTKVLMVTAISPVKIDDKYLGSTGADIDIAFLQKIAKDIKPYETGYTTIIANNNTYAANPDDNLLNKPVEENTFGNMVKKAIAEKKELTFEYKDKSTGLEWYHDIQPLFIGNNNLPWAVSVSVPLEKVLNPANQGLRFAVLTGSIGLVVLAILIFTIGTLVSQKIINSIKILTEYTEKNTSNARDIKVASDKLAHYTNQQSLLVNNTMKSMDEINKTILESSKKATDSKNLANKVSSKTENGKKVMEKFVNAMQQIHNTNVQLQQIVGVIFEIEKKTLVINQIVTKTQLLSLNASIEAARAGEFGKGFSVVAEEVANLAQLSGDSAKEIQELIKESTGKVQEILGLTEGRIKEGKTVSEDVIKVFLEIDESVHSISQAIDIISKLAITQEQSIQQNVTAIKQIGNTATQNIEGVNNVSSCAKNVQSNSLEMEKVTNEISDAIIGNRFKEQH